ncbi:two pore domain potassium channel family protein [Streptomyces lunaelactis]|uniref:Two pore domain potassium channel family protein n=2 Tax=Streptomyces lunaelactis TaxID=1535768 RepID=A0A2R4TER4_9ACTN|nr:two pore domain potassium channel family protein [Streptomyces lunaelactis]
MAIIGSEHPPLRAIEALATAVPLFLLLFAAAYFLMAWEQASSFNEQLSRTDALYFTVTVFATVGFGDIVPTSGPARVLTMVQMLMDLILVGLIAKVVFGAVQMGLERRRSAPGSAEREP